MFDEKGRLFGLINVVDLLVLIVLLAGAVAGYQRLVAPDQTAVNTRQLQIDVLVSGVRQPTVDAVTEDEQVIETTSNRPLGTVVDKRVEPAVVLQLLEDGRTVETHSEDHFDLTATIRGPAQVSPNVIRMAGQEIRIGTELQFRTNIYAVKGTVMGIETVSGEPLN